jgi:transposase InsO family protein
MPWKTMNAQEQRVQFVVAASRGEGPFSRLCEEFGISRPTGLLWVQRYREAGLAGIAERSRRPLHSPWRTAAELEEQVVALRRRYPDWGARKLRVLLCAQGVQLPRNTIHRILLRHGLVREVERQAAATQRFERAEPNQLWQMDFKGPKHWHQTVGPLSVLDDHSRYLLVLQAVGSTRAELVREQLESAFQRCGVPEGMLMDHGIPWWNPSGASSLALWLMKQGIGLHWSRIRHPQTQGKVERFHGALQRALDCRGGAGEDAQAWLDQYRWEHNHVRPHEALAMQTPASHWRRSPRSYDPNPPRWEYPPEAWVRKVDSSGKLKLADRNWNISQSLAGDWVQLVKIEQRVQVYYCRSLIRELDLEGQRSTIVERCPSPEVPQQKL